MENIVMKSNQEESQDQHLSRVFRRVQQYNMKLNPEKCTFGVNAYNFWSFIVRKEGYRPTLTSTKKSSG